ncbi:5652_t:CDS:2, partial [Acaulospora colombiana]
AVMSQSRASVSLLSEASVASVASVSSISQAALTTSSTPPEIKPINNGPSKTQAIVGGTIGGGPSPYTGHPGVTPALVYDEPTRPSIAHQSGFGGNMPLYPSNVASFYEPTSPHTKVVSEESAIKGEDGKCVEGSIDARAVE